MGSARKIIPIPEPLDSDSSELADALDIARALWERGELDDARRWLRHAVDQAERSEQATRIICLARALANLAEANAQPSPAPPPPSSHRRLSSPAPPLRKTISGITPVIPPVPAARTNASGRPMAPVAKEPAATTTPTPLHSMTVPSTHVAKPATLPTAALKAPPIPAFEAVMPSPEVRIRVSIRTSVRDPGLLVVRRLADGAPVPPGTREGFILVTDMASFPDVTDPIDEACLVNHEASSKSIG